MDLRARLTALSKIDRAPAPVVTAYLNTRWADEHQRDRVNVPQGLDQIPTLLLRKPGCSPFDGANHVIGPEQHVHPTKPGCFLKQPDLPGTKIVKAAGNEDLGRAHLNPAPSLILIGKDPGTALSDTT